MPPWTAAGSTDLDHLRDTFPGWAISYSLHQRVWTARTRDTTIDQNSAALLAIALTLSERKQHQARNNPRPDP
jgi:alkylhydroperoxidase/carboxymuconolactone decarboxylase family protein YurZ